MSHLVYQADESRSVDLQWHNCSSALLQNEIQEPCTLAAALPDFCRLNLRDDAGIEGAADKMGLSDREGLSDSTGPADKPAGCCAVSKGDLRGCMLGPSLGLVKLA